MDGVAGIPVVGAGDGALETAEPGVMLHNVSSADMSLSKVCITGFERRLRFAPSPLKLPLNFAA